MASSVTYKKEHLWYGSTSRFEDLSEKLLSLAHQKSIDPYSPIVQFMETLGHNLWGFIDKDLNSKKEVIQLAELLELAIKEWKQDGFYDYYNYEENGEIKNAVLSEYKYFAQRLKEIAAHEWKDDNLFIDRAESLEYIAPMLLFFARKKNLDANSNIMQFLRKLYHRKTKDIEIYSKEELWQFIELTELSVQALINNGYFKQHEIIINGKTFNYALHNYLIYIQRLKEVANDWDNAVSEDWKQGKIRTIKEKTIIHNYEPVKAEESPTSTSTIKDFIKLIFYSILMFISIISILWFLVFVTKYLPLVF